MVDAPIAFIPARGGSVRVKDKNIRPLLGIPLIVYAIEGAKNAGIFEERIYVSSDSEKILKIAEHRGVRTIQRPEQFAHPNSWDWQWIHHAITTLELTQGPYFILRPTNPFRTSKTIIRAWREWDPWYDSLRGLEVAGTPHQKQWHVNGKKAERLQPGMKFGQFYCDLPGQVLIPTHDQTGFIQIGEVEKSLRQGNPTGRNVQAFLGVEFESENIDTEKDWTKVLRLAEAGDGELEPVTGYERTSDQIRKIKAHPVHRKAKNKAGTVAG